MDRKKAVTLLDNIFCRGWMPLVNEVFDHLPEGSEVKRVWQKYQGLRFDVSGTTKEFEHFIFEIEQKSELICRFCGLNIKECSKTEKCSFKLPQKNLPL